jgi:hypothetical protein
MTSNFDPSVFLQATTTEANTRRPPIPGGTVLLGTIGEPKIRQTEGKKEAVLGQTFTWLDLPIALDLTANPTLREKIGQDSVTLNWSTRLDTTEQGGFDMSTGKNNGLRQLREALDLNKPGDTFGLLMVQGRPVRCSIKNEPYEGEVYDKIDKLSRA